MVGRAPRGLPWRRKPLARSLAGTEGGPPKFPGLVDVFTFFDYIKWEEVITAYFTLPLAEFFQGRVMHMEPCHLLPEVIDVVHSRSEELEAVVLAIKVASDGLNCPPTKNANTTGNGDQSLHMQAISERKPGVHQLSWDTQGFGDGRISHWHF